MRLPRRNCMVHVLTRACVWVVHQCNGDGRGVASHITAAVAISSFHDDARNNAVSVYLLVDYTDSSPTK
jgi:hypothetical protein